MRFVAYFLPVISKQQLDGSEEGLPGGTGAEAFPDVYFNTNTLYICIGAFEIIRAVKVFPVVYGKINALYISNHGFERMNCRDESDS